MTHVLRRLAKIFAALALIALLALAGLWLWIRPPDLHQPPELDPPALPVPEQGRLVLDDVTIVEPGVSRAAARRLTIEGGRIVSIDAHEPAAAEAGATRRYAKSFVLPGLVDMHGHHPFSWLKAEAELWDLLYLAHGVTTLRDPGVADGTPVGTSLLDLRRRLRDGEIPGPRLYTCGAMVSGPWELPGTPVARSAEDAHAIVAELAAAGVDCIKVRSRLSPAALAGVREAAKEHRLLVIGHVPLGIPFEEAHLDDAQHFFGFSESRPVRRWADLWGGWSRIDTQRMDEIVRISLEQGMAHTPTLVVWARHARLLDPAQRDDPVLRLLPSHWRAAVWVPGASLLWFLHDLEPGDLAALREALPKMRELLRRLHAAGVRVHAGSDAIMPGVVPGASLHEELHQFVEAGLAVEEVWAVATRRAGEWLGEPGLGTLQVGAPADLLVFRDDPTRDLAALATLEAVVAQGRLYTREWLDDALGRTRRHFASREYEAWSLGIDRRLARSAKLTGVALRALVRFAPE